MTSERLMPELVFTTSRSSGPGGQNVNKVNTKVTLRWHVAASKILTPEEQLFLLAKLARYLTTEGEVVISAQEKRSQPENKLLALAKLDRLLVKAYERPKPRKATKPSKGAVQKRLEQKKKHSNKKKWRGRGVD
ncbi:MAG: alternative ribosome rescue aminoacyl-tRNA hydrolase ArfB [Bacteroidota bacterium]